MIWAFLAMLLGAQDTPPQTAADYGCPSLPVGTVLQIAVAQNLQSHKVKSGEFFRIELAEDFVVDGKIVIPKGTPGIGQIVQASHKTFFSTDEGELLVAGRYLIIGGRYLPLRKFRINSTTQSVPDRRVMTYDSNVDIPAGAVSTGQVSGECLDAVPEPVPMVK